MARRLTQDDFVTGLLAAMVKRGFAAISIRGDAFYHAMASAYETLEAIAENYAVRPRFVVVLDPIHHDSPAVRQAISSAVLRDLASLDNPEYQDLRFKFGPEEADRLLASLPGGSELFERIAAAFVDVYPYVAV